MTHSLRKPHSTLYREWRRTITDDDKYLLPVLMQKTLPEVYAIRDSLLTGLTAERLDPDRVKLFHNAAQIVDECISKMERVKLEAFVGNGKICTTTAPAL